jgi:predicted nucleic acid-binding protein
MRKPTIYIETSVISYLAGRKSRDLFILTRQEMTHLWWESFRDKYALFTSEIVVMEAGKGDPDAVARRMSYLQDVPILEYTIKIEEVVSLYMLHMNYPEKAVLDAFHLAFSVQSGLDYLLTWNCTHLANEFFQRKLVKLNSDHSIKTPLIVTPEDMIFEEEE